jgi:hypothetical protein
MKEEAFKLADELENKPNAYGDCAQDWLLAAAAMIRSLAVALDFSGKPVAWMQTHHKTGKPTRFSEFQTWEDDVPLYTAPIELSDEEIMNVAFCSEVSTVAIENDWDGTVIDFARAILKKASEK